MSKPVHHIVRILPSSYALLRYLSATGDLQEIKDARLQHDQFRGNLYQPSYKLLKSLQPKGLNLLKMGSHQIVTELYRLPMAEYVALLGETCIKQKFDLEALSRQLLTTHSAEEALQLFQQMPQAPQPFALPFTCSTSFQARWQAKKTLLARKGQHWFLVLYFDLQHLDHGQTETQTEVAIDIGLSPLISAYYAESRTDYCLHNPVPRHLLQLPANMPREHLVYLQYILYSLYRQKLETFLDDLLIKASWVYLEDFDYPNLDANFLTISRLCGLFDYHESWLHQRLQICDIPFEKVWPNGTSRRCHRCPDHPFGERRGKLFSCPSCGLHLDADQNAARNIFIRGRKKRGLETVW